MTDDQATDFTTEEEMADERYVRGYRHGMRDAVRWLAIWNDGQQFVGVMRRPMKQVLLSIAERPIRNLVTDGWSND